jgi:hypothetical protein
MLRTQYLVILPPLGLWGRLGEHMQQAKMVQKNMKIVWVGELLRKKTPYEI